jgi:hypothetical protein
MSHNKSLLLIAAFVMLATGCSNTRTVRVAVPPRVDLRNYQTVGLVGFSSNARNGLDRVATERFLRAVQAAQPGTRVVELGSEQDVLASVGARGWTRDTLRDVKEKHGVDAVVIGRLDLEKEKPQVSFSSMVKQVDVRQDVNAELIARVVETDSGATMWTDSARCKTNLANGSFGQRSGHFDAKDADQTYGEMVDGLVYRVTDAFRVHYVTREVPKEAVAAAE